MTKDEAIKQMANGRRVKHYLFSEDEFIFMVNGSIYDENDYKMEHTDANGNLIDFWTDRTNEQWLDGWIVLPDINNTITEPEPFIIKKYHGDIDYRPAYVVRFPNEKYISKNSHKRSNKRKNR